MFGISEVNTIEPLTAHVRSGKSPMCHIGNLFGEQKSQEKLARMLAPFI
jgi:hypothetical protein